MFVDEFGNALLVVDAEDESVKTICFDGVLSAALEGADFNEPWLNTFLEEVVSRNS